ncbi:MAG: hypothetical protein JNL50_10395 [Phycisphaerae bacterium]|nr:hypothetical protein [Phycisphaerae bacterium]
MNTPASQNQRRRLRPFTAVLGMCALAATLLLWTKLRLVNGIPRTAVAEPMPELAPAPRLPDPDAPPSPNEDWSGHDRIPPFE